MTVRVSNQWVAESRARLFAFGVSFLAETPMAGRREAGALLERVLTEDGSATALLSEFLGVGKTFFVMGTIGRLARRNRLDLERDVARVTVEQVIAGLSERPTAAVLVLEELDRKTSSASIEAAVDWAAEWAMKGTRRVVLTGDYSLRRPGLVTPAAFPSITPIFLEPLTKSLFTEAIRLRVAHWLSAAGEGARTADAAAASATEQLFDDDLLRALLPPTDPPISTFRDVLRLVQQMAEYLPLDTAPARFTPVVYRRYRAARMRPRQWTSEQAALLAYVNGFISDGILTPEPITPMSVRELHAAVAGELRPEDFELDVVIPLVQAGALVAVGIPFSDEARERDIVGPYLPSITQFASRLLTPA